MSQAGSSEDAQSLVVSVVNVVDELITNPDRDTIIAGLNAEIEMVQSRFTVLSAIRDSLISEAEEDSEELPLAEPDPEAQPDRNSLESRIVRYIGDAGPTLPGVVADAMDVHSTKIGRIVSASSSLEKRYITGKGSCIVLKA